ncbi:MAG: hypothetical protein EYC70_16295 [Planctomycetota bacterium]|nr:MAG: hypothetical protein EYC70_16295 [Planctomycetota bacterium]
MSFSPQVLAVQAYSFRRRMLSWKALPALMVALVPTFMALVFRFFAPHEQGGTPTPYRMYGEILAPMCLYFVLPFLSMLVMLPILGELYEKGAIAYLLTRPAPRWVPLLGLYSGGLLALLPLAVLCATLPALILSPISGGVELRFWLQRVVFLSLVLWIGAAPYGALCLFLGVWSRKAVLWALALLIGWGSIAGSITGPLRALSPHRYLFGLLRNWLDLSNTLGQFSVPDPDPPGTLLSLLVLAGYVLAFLVLAYQAIRTRDVL